MNPTSHDHSLLVIAFPAALGSLMKSYGIAALTSPLAERLAARKAEGPWGD